mmetsp:Transcript_12978/g.28055  ORF Transcript_12978/g.28055 Transcript_12978/m.28055 type:complete len:220 (+) Transcript_12978:663-1322(+)
MAAVLGHHLDLLADQVLAQNLLCLVGKLGLLLKLWRTDAREREAPLGAAAQIGHDERVARDDLDNLGGKLAHVVAVVWRHVVAPDAQPLLLGGALGGAQRRRVVAQRRRPLDNLGEANLDELELDRASRVDDAAQHGAVLVQLLQLHLHVAVHQPALDEEARLAAERLSLLDALLVAANRGALDARQDDGHLLVAWQQHHANDRARRDLLDDGLLQRAL